MRARGLMALVATLAVVGSVAVSASTVDPEPTAPAIPALAEAPDAATAVLAARRQGTRVEITSERTDTRTTFADPDGGQTSELTAVPTRVRRAGGWVDVDTTLATRPDGSVGPKATVDDLVLSGGGSDAALARLAKDGKTLAVHWPTALPKPVLAGNAATYPEVLPGVDLVMRAERTGYQQHLVVKNADAARNPALASIALSFAQEVSWHESEWAVEAHVKVNDGETEEMLLELPTRYAVDPAELAAEVLGQVRMLAAGRDSAIRRFVGGER